VYDFRASAIQYEFSEHTIIDNTLSPALANARDLINTVRVDVTVQDELHRESMAKIKWHGEMVPVLDTVVALVWPCTASMPIDALQNAGATFAAHPLIGVQGPSRVVHGVNLINPGAELLIEDFQGFLSKRFMQPVSKVFSYTVQDRNSVDQLGPLEDSLEPSLSVTYDEALAEAFMRKSPQTKWLCSASGSLQYPRDTQTSYMPNDPLMPVANTSSTGGANVGYVTYPLYSIQYDLWDEEAIPDIADYAFYLDEDNVRHAGIPQFGELFYDFANYVIDGDASDITALKDTALAVGRTRVLAAHRQNRLSFSTFLNPHLRRGHTIRVNTQPVKATGVIYQMQHLFDVDQGTALTNITLAISSSKALGLTDVVYDNLRFKIPVQITVKDSLTREDLPLDNSTVNYSQSLRQYVGIDPDTFAYDNQDWGGFFTSVSGTKYQEFVVEWPDLPEVNTSNATIVTDGGIVNVDVPNDEFRLTA
jgi:hypothetical protein